MKKKNAVRLVFRAEGRPAVHDVGLILLISPDPLIHPLPVCVPIGSSEKARRYHHTEAPGTVLSPSRQCAAAPLLTSPIVPLAANADRDKESASGIPRTALAASCRQIPPAADTSCACLMGAVLLSLR